MEETRWAVIAENSETVNEHAIEWLTEKEVCFLKSGMWLLTPWMIKKRGKTQSEGKRGHHHRSYAHEKDHKRIFWNT